MAETKNGSDAASGPITLVIADDHVVVRAGLRRLIDSEENFTVVGEASDGAEAVRQCLQKKPDVALLDVNMPVTNGITAAAEIRASCPGTRVVMLTFQPNVAVIRAAVQAGVHGFVVKGSTENELFDAIRAASQGKRYIAQHAADVMVETLFGDEAATGAGAVSPGGPLLRGLSSRELQVLQMLAEGRSNAAIAETLNLSPKTVETYRSRIMVKLAVSSFAELVRVAVRAGLVDRDEQ